MTEFKVVESFISINGEGVLAGQLAVFVRFQGCNLSCRYCDTVWANEADAEFTRMSGEEIYQMVKETGVKNVTLTGGEPLFREGIRELLELLAKDEELRVEIETNGSIDLEPYLSIPNRPAFTMDYKLGYSGMESAMKKSNLMLLDQMDTVKFVVGSMEDLNRAAEVIQEYDLTELCHVYFSPVFGSIDPKDIVEFMKEHRLNGVNLQLQMHKFIWPPQQRGV